MDEITRAFARPNREGAAKKGVPEDAARKIFGKVNGHNFDIPAMPDGFRSSSDYYT